LKRFGFRQRKKELGIIGVVGCGNFFARKQAWCSNLLHLLKMVGLYKIFPIKIIWILFATPRTRSVWRVEILVGAFMMLKESYIKIMVLTKTVYVFG
jgi:hypothetical protein